MSGVSDAFESLKYANTDLHEFSKKLRKKVNQSRYRPGVAQRVPGS
jgi:hypothetical protein